MNPIRFFDGEAKTNIKPSRQNGVHLVINFKVLFLNQL